MAVPDIISSWSISRVQPGLHAGTRWNMRCSASQMNRCDSFVELGVVCKSYEDLYATNALDSYTVYTVN